MLISSAMNDQINQQIGHEFGASFQYVNIAGYFDGAALPVLSRHFLRQADEEREHAMKFVRYVLDAGGKVAVPAIPAARADFASAEEAVALALEWELTVTKQISALLDRASTPYLVERFLPPGGVVTVTADTIHAELQPAPLGVVLVMVGVDTFAYRVPWLEQDVVVTHRAG
jgi:bacterioferritin (cytochrome b1)